MNSALQYVIYAAFAFGIILMFLGIRRVIQIIFFIINSRVTVTNQGRADEALHIDTPKGPVDVQIRQAHDPGFDSIPKYPGAVPLDSQPEYEIQFHVIGHEGSQFEQGYWTSDLPSMVIDYYKREFPAWKEDRYFRFGEPEGGCRLEEQTPGRDRYIEILYDTGAMRYLKNIPAARTLIRYGVLYGNDLPTLPSK